MSQLTDAQMKAALPALVKAFPEEWRGTTFKNNALLGREQFSQRLINLVATKGSDITTQDLIDLGNAEDYLRVSSNISCVLETVMAVEQGLNIAQVFTFSSQVLPIFSVLLMSGSQAVHLYVGEGGNLTFSEEEQQLLKLLGINLTIYQSNPQVQQEGIVLSTVDGEGVHGLIKPNLLVIRNTEKINPANILRIRKRMSTPITTPLALGELQRIAGLEVTSGTEQATEQALNDFYSHLQTMSGTQADAQNFPACFTAGLPAICSFWMSFIANGGADILMASTAYGGSSELTDLLNERAQLFNKHKFDITGNNDIQKSIQDSLNALAAQKDQLLPTTILFIEIPTNPDMKVPEIQTLAQMASEYKKQTGKNVVLFIDTTFAPASQVMEKVTAVAPELTTLVFISMSKSVSRGITTAGTIIAGSTQESHEILKRTKLVQKMLDTEAKVDQLLALSKYHIGVEQRCENAYKNAASAGDALVNAVRENAKGHEMHLHFPTPEQAKIGFSSSTFSFNLPPLATQEQNDALPQRFVDLICAHAEFKPCVSFGQDNDLVYATVPATSTQGAIKLEDKAKQAMGGVQLVRLSFPPTCNIESVRRILADAVAQCYA